MKRAVDNIRPSRVGAGIGWRTIVGIMLIGFKTEGINLPSFIMVPRGPFFARILLSSSLSLSVAIVLSSSFSLDTHLHEIRKSPLFQTVFAFPTTSDRFTRGIAQPPARTSIYRHHRFPRCEMPRNRNLKYEVYLGSFKTSFAGGCPKSRLAALIYRISAARARNVFMDL